MDGAWPQRQEASSVMRCRVALVLSERIAWEDSVRFPHPTVTGHFSDVGCAVG